MTFTSSRHRTTYLPSNYMPVICSDNNNNKYYANRGEDVN